MVGTNAAITSLSSEIFVAVSAFRMKWRVSFHTSLSDSRRGAFRAQVTTGSRHFFAARVFSIRCLLSIDGGYGGWRTRGSNRGWYRGRADAGIPGGTSREVTELIRKVAKFFIIIFVVICFELVVVAVGTACTIKGEITETLRCQFKFRNVQNKRFFDPDSNQTRVWDSTANFQRKY